MIALLSAPDWASEEGSLLVENPTWVQVESAIRNLNNEARNDVYLHPHGDDLETYLAIGGGNGQYIVVGAKSNTSFPALVRRDEPGDPKIELIVGGQPGEYPANWVADLGSALEAAKAFFDAGGFASNYEWTEL